MKKAVLFLLILSIICILFGIFYFQKNSDYKYNILEDGTVEISKYTGKAENLVIPSKIAGKSVTAIGDYAFSHRESLTSITIPDSVNSIGKTPFESSKKIKNIIVSADHPYLKTIDGVLFSKPDKRLVFYPEALSATSYEIPEGTEIIGDNAFRDCSALTDIIIPDSVTSIGDCAFEYCSSLTSITIPNSVSSIGNNPFKDCKSLNKINVSVDNPYLETNNNVLFSKMDKRLICYPAALSTTVVYTIPKGTNIVGDYAFYECTALTRIMIPDSVTSIGDYSFYCCTALNSITIPDSVTSIGKYAFSICPLTSITIPDSVTSIGKYAFVSTYLDSITIPDSVTSIEEHTFDSCFLSEITIPDTVTYIGNGAFYGCMFLDSITIPDSVTYIGDYAFYECKHLTSITIPDSVTSIGNNAFKGCPSSMKATVSPNSYAMQYCKDNDIKYTY